MSQLDVMTSILQIPKKKKPNQLRKAHKNQNNQRKIKRQQRLLKRRQKKTVVKATKLLKVQRKVNPVMIQTKKNLMLIQWMTFLITMNHRTNRQTTLNSKQTLKIFHCDRPFRCFQWQAQPRNLSKLLSFEKFGLLCTNSLFQLETSTLSIIF